MFPSFVPFVVNSFNSKSMQTIYKLFIALCTVYHAHCLVYLVIVIMQVKADLINILQHLNQTGKHLQYNLTLRYTNRIVSPF